MGFFEAFLFCVILFCVAWIVSFVIEIIHPQPQWVYTFFCIALVVTITIVLVLLCVLAMGSR